MNFKLKNNLQNLKKNCMATNSSKKVEIDLKYYHVWKIVILTFGEHFKCLRLLVFENLLNIEN